VFLFGLSFSSVTCPWGMSTVQCVGVAVIVFHNSRKGTRMSQTIGAALDVLQ